MDRHTTLTARIAQLEAELADARAEARREADDSQAHADDAHWLGYHCAIMDAIAVCETEGGSAPAVSSRIAAQIRRLDRERKDADR